MHEPISILGSFLLCDKKEKTLTKNNMGEERVYLSYNSGSQSIIWGKSRHQELETAFYYTHNEEHRKEHTSRLLLACGKPVSSPLTQSRAPYPFKDALEQRRVRSPGEIRKAVLSGWRNNSCSDVEMSRRDGNVCTESVN